ncbi:MAG: hypothetical protein ACXV8I_05205 [Methylobacter sp.]
MSPIGKIPEFYKASANVNEFEKLQGDEKLDAKDDHLFASCLDMGEWFTREHMNSESARLYSRTGRNQQKPKRR